MNNILLRIIFLLFLLPVGALDASNHDVLTIRGANNALNNVHVGDINLERTNNVFNLITLGGNETVDKLNSMIRTRIFSSNRIPENALISYNKPRNKMFIVDKATGLITEVDCYLGSERLLGSVVARFLGNSKVKPSYSKSHTHPAVPGCVSARSHTHKGSSSHQHNYSCSGRSRSPSPPANNHVFQPPSNSY